MLWASLYVLGLRDADLVGAGVTKSGTSLSVCESQHVSAVLWGSPWMCEWRLTELHRTNHAIGVDQLISAAEALRVKVKREDVLARRRKALAEIR